MSLLIMKKKLHYLLTFFSAFLYLTFLSFNLLFANPIPMCMDTTFCNQWEKQILDKVIKEVQYNSYRIKTVVIDAGHGGKDSGCSGASSKEKHIALAIAKNLQGLIHLNYPDIKVIMTRDADIFIPLNERAAIANRNNADLFISIHCNFIPKSTATNGSETYVLGLHRAEDNLAVAKRENASILLEDDYEKNYDGFDPNSDEGHIILSMYQNAFLEQSILFASLVEEQLQFTANRASKGVKQAGFLVLRETAMPSVLIETGFLSNRTEESFLQSEVGQEASAVAIFEAFQKFKRMSEQVEPKKNVASATNTKASPSGTTVKVNTPVTTKPSNPSTKPATTKTTPPQAIPVHNGATTKSEQTKVDRIDPYASEHSSTSGTNKPTSATVNKSENQAKSSLIHYRIQLSASKNRLDTKENRWQNIPYSVELIWEDDLHKYQIRNIRNFQEADRIRTEMINRGFSGAFIIAYKGSEKISIQEAVQYGNNAGR